MQDSQKAVNFSRSQQSFTPNSYSSSLNSTILYRELISIFILFTETKFPIEGRNASYLFSVTEFNN